MFEVAYSINGELKKVCFSMKEDALKFYDDILDKNKANKDLSNVTNTDFSNKCKSVGIPVINKIPVDLTGNRLDHGNGFGNLRILEFSNVPVQKSHFRILLLHPGPGVFHTHLLLQQRLRKYGVDEFTV